MIQAQKSELIEIVESGCLINRQLKAYQANMLPKVTFWGFANVFGHLHILSPEYTASLKARKGKAAFLKEVFSFESYTLLPALPENRAEKTRWNMLSQVWHLTWKYGSTPAAFLHMVDTFRKNPQYILEAIRCNVEKLYRSGNVERENAGETAQFLLKHIAPAQFEELGKIKEDRFLPLLLVACLVGSDVALSTPILTQLKGWLTDEPAVSEAQTDLRPIPSLGIYHVKDSEIDTRMLPNIRVGDSHTYVYDGILGSPLHQIISEYKNQRYFYLCGKPNEGETVTTVSGVGKTTSLRFLAFESSPYSTMLLPLAEIYDLHSIDDRNVLRNYIKRYFGAELDHLDPSTILLFDGLDELVSAEQLDCVSRDLEYLQRKGICGLVVSSKLPWGELPGLNALLEWFSVWEVFLVCNIQALTKEQQKLILRAQSASQVEIPAMFSTPFVLSLYLHTAFLSSDAKEGRIAKRWNAEKLFNGDTVSEDAIFYRSLVVQIVRWQEAVPGKGAQWERDAFLLFHVLPQIAFQLLRSEIADPYFNPSARDQVDQAYIKRAIASTIHVCLPQITLLPGYRADTPPQRYRRALRDLSIESFLDGAAPSLFCSGWDMDGTTPRFVHNALRDHLAYLHVANVFLLACNDALETTTEAIFACGQTIELIPQEQIAHIVEMFDLISPNEKMSQILEKGPKPEIKNTLSQFLTSHIAATVCKRYPGACKNVASIMNAWYGSMADAFEALQNHDDPSVKEAAIKQFGIAYVFGMVEYARNYRVSGDYLSANACADQVIRFNMQHPEIVNSDGYHMKAQILWAQIQPVLNGERSATAFCVEESELEIASSVYAELAQLASSPMAKRKWFPQLSDSQKKVVPVFLMMLHRSQLRYQVYKERAFFNSPALKAVIEASLVAKAYSILSACSEGNSGTAYNLLGSMLINDDETLENNEGLPLFRNNPTLHIDIPGLNYENRFAAAYRVFSCIYEIKRGPQPYSARKMCELLLRRQVRLDSMGEPVEACQSDAFTSSELAFLDRAARKAITNGGITENYWRGRYQYDLAVKLHPDDTTQAKQTLCRVWKKCGCVEKIRSKMPKGVDITSVQAMIEDLLLNGPKDLYKREKIYDHIFSYLRRYQSQAEERLRFTTGSLPQTFEVEDCIWRMERYAEINHDERILRFAKARYGF